MFTVNGVSEGTSGASGTVFTLNQDYVVFKNVVADNDDIGVSFGLNNGQSFSAFNGLQLQAVVAAPEPSTWAMMLGGLGILFVVLRRRAVTSV